MISIILPVYNVEGYLQNCVESILQQSYRDWELIMVDDGSTDSSGALCDQLAKRDSRIRVIHQRNKGLSGARNTGMEVMKGDYVTFIDSDDSVHPEFLNVLYTNLINENADISGAGFREVTPAFIPTYSEIPNHDLRVFTPEEAVEEILYQNRTKGRKGDPLTNTAWGYLSKRELWDNLRWKEGILYEDLELFYKLFFKAKKIVASSLPLYYYTMRESSILHIFNEKRKIVLDITHTITLYMLKNHPNLKKAAEDRELSASFNILMLMSRYGDKDTATTERCWHTIKKLRYCSLINPKVRIKNKIGVLASYIFGTSLFRLIPQR